MKKVSASAKMNRSTNQAASAAVVKAPVNKKAKNGTSSLEEGKTLTSSNSINPEKEVEEIIANAAEEAKRKVASENNGHKEKKTADVLVQMHKSKFLPIADGMYTSNVYFQPVRVVESRRTWIDVDMREVFIGAGVMEHTELHTFSMEADDLLRMLYLADMFTMDYINMKRTAYEQWVLEIFSKIIENEPQADYSDRGHIASYALEHVEGLALGKCGRIQYFFQKRCVYVFLDVPPNINMLGENAMGVKAKSSRGKFEYMIELHVISMPISEEQNEINDKRELESGDVPEMN